jgi:hypothetical protein
MLTICMSINIPYVCPVFLVNSRLINVHLFSLRFHETRSHSFKGSKLLKLRWEVHSLFVQHLGSVEMASTVHIVATGYTSKSDITMCPVEVSFR